MLSADAAPTVQAATAGTEMYRFFNKQNGSHFYTASPTERDSVRQNLGNVYNYEGPAYKFVTPAQMDAAIAAAGIAGPVGPQGPQGVIGPAGQQGPKGDTGAVGPAGPMGLQGLMGLMGLKGDKGDQGDVGPAGATGAVGQMGPKGDAGDIGPAGPQGQQGVQGEAAVAPVRTPILTQLGSAAPAGGMLHNFDYTVPQGDQWYVIKTIGWADLPGFYQTMEVRQDGVVVARFTGPNYGGGYPGTVACDIPIAPGSVIRWVLNLEGQLRGRCGSPCLDT